jgi:hypothetical protein
VVDRRVHVVSGEHDEVALERLHDEKGSRRSRRC